MKLTGPLVVLEGRPAFLLSAVLSGHLRNRHSLRSLLAEIGVDESDQAVAIEAALSLTEAGEEWRRSRLPQRGNAETRGNGVSPDSDVMVTVADAASLLRLCERRVRQLATAGDIPGERTSRGWRFARRDVVGLRDRREARTA